MILKFLMRVEKKVSFIATYDTVAFFSYFCINRNSFQ